MSELAKRSTVDRTGWGEGPWDGEPDRVDFKAHGLPCFISRAAVSGAWCGYVGVPREHVSYGQDYAAVDRLVLVHGGLTYSAPCDEAIGICHVPEPGEPDDVWWLGFDCGHAGDLMPAMFFGPASFALLGDVYRDMAYVREQTERLAAQLRIVNLER